MPSQREWGFVSNEGSESNRESLVVDGFKFSEIKPLAALYFDTAIIKL